MTLSREARIVLAVLAVALAALVWVNYYSGSGQLSGIFSRPRASAAPPIAAAPGATPPLAQRSGAAGDSAGAGTLPTALPSQSTAPVVARDIRIAQLPFLVTAPPPAPAATTAAATPEAAAAEPSAGRRVSVNPFSPIFVRQAAAPAAAGRARSVNVPAGPPSTTIQAVRAPAPMPVVPRRSELTGLPHALPGGTLPVATEILRQARTGAAPSGFNVADVAAVNVPQSVSDAELAEFAGARTPVNTSAPLVAGADGLSRFLRDNNVVFTGSVLGPVGVGVFRSSLSERPSVVALGQPLPNTQIVLTSLKGQQAVLTQGDQSQTLILDFRR